MVPDADANRIRIAQSAGWRLPGRMELEALPSQGSIREIWRLAHWPVVLSTDIRVFIGIFGLVRIREAIRDGRNYGALDACRIRASQEGAYGNALAPGDDLPPAAGL